MEGPTDMALEITHPSSTDSDHLLIPRFVLKSLSETLRRIPGLAVDLEILTTRQSSIGCSSIGGGSRRDRVYPLPYSERGSEAAEVLHNTLGTWVRHVCETRAVEYLPVGYTHRHGEFVGPLREGQRRMPIGYKADTPSAFSRWLDRNLIALAMTEGCEEAPDEIAHAVKFTLRALDRAPERTRYIDPNRVAEAQQDAREALLPAAGIEALARQLGAPYESLTARRVYTLHNAKRITKHPVDVGEDVFRCGDVFDAHLAYPARRKKVPA